MVENRLTSDPGSDLEDDLISIRDFLKGEMKKRGLLVSRTTPKGGRVREEQRKRGVEPGKKRKAQEVSR